MQTEERENQNETEKHQPCWPRFLIQKTFYLNIDEICTGGCIWLSFLNPNEPLRSRKKDQQVN